MEQTRALQESSTGKDPCPRQCETGKGVQASLSHRAFTVMGCFQKTLTQDVRVPAASLAQG